VNETIKKMIKKIIYLVILIIPAFAFMDVLSNGAPAESTGAPAEPNCTKSGCHQDFTANSGSGTPDLTVAGGTSSYIPGFTYALTASINQTGINTFGFQVVALADRDSSNVGTLVVTEGGRTQIISGFGSLTSRQYMTYTFPGTAAIVSGHDQWAFKWIAPSSDVGPVTFYLAAIAANGDGTDMGDYCYLKKLNLVCSPAGIDEYSTETCLSVFPNPFTDKVTVSYSVEKDCNVNLELFSIKGEKIAAWDQGKQSPGRYSKTINLETSCPAGIYILRVLKDQESSTKRIVITR
jgi:hypothetical protein